jgi:hypothetical protein
MNTENKSLKIDKRKDELIVDAAKLVVMCKSGSVSLLKRELWLGYNRAGRIMNELQELNIVSELQGSDPRKVLIENQEQLRVHLVEKGIDPDNLIGSWEKPKAKSTKQPVEVFMVSESNEVSDYWLFQDALPKTRLQKKTCICMTEQEFQADMVDFARKLPQYLNQGHSAESALQRYLSGK